jgi:hypothetical protein
MLELLQRTHSALDGRVVFTFWTHQTLTTESIRMQLDKQLPDLSGADKVVAGIWWGYKQCLPYTVHISFNLNEGDDPRWHVFEEWWKSCVPSGDHRAIWEVYEQFTGYGLANIWYEAYQATRYQQAQASITLQPGAEQIEDGDFLKEGKPTSEKSSGLPVKSSEQKKKRKRKPSASEKAALQS